MAQKIAVTGDINGKLTEFFEKLSALQSKQNFAFAIIAGNLFAGNLFAGNLFAGNLFAGNLADSDTASSEEAEDLAKLINGEIEVPVATYFTVGKRPLPEAVIEKLNSNDGELCPNLIALGRKGERPCRCILRRKASFTAQNTATRTLTRRRATTRRISWSHPSGQPAFAMAPGYPSTDPHSLPHQKACQNCAQP
jgi:hypothetical protein